MFSFAFTGKCSNFFLLSTVVDIVPKAIYDLMKRWCVTAPQTRLNSRTMFSSALLLQSSTATPLRAPVQNFSTLTETFCHEISCLEGRSCYSPIWWSYRGSQVSVHLEQRRAWVEPSVDFETVTILLVCQKPSVTQGINKSL